MAMTPLVKKPENWREVEAALAAERRAKDLDEWTKKARAEGLAAGIPEEYTKTESYLYLYGNASWDVEREEFLKKLAGFLRKE